MSTITAPHPPPPLAKARRWAGRAGALSVALSVLATAAARAFRRWQVQRQPGGTPTHRD